MLWAYALWGLFGGFAVEGLEFAGAIRRTGNFPWREEGEPDLAPFAVSVIVRLAISAGLSTAVAASNQVSGAFGAVTIGAGAPLIFQQIVRQAASGTAAGKTQTQHAVPHTAEAPPDGLKTALPHPARPAKEQS